MNSEKLAFYKWIYKWVSSNNISAEEGPVDTPQIAAVLQAMGYKLEVVDHVVSDEKSLDTTEIIIKCNKSGMRAVLSKQIENCVCPSEKASDGHFWSVSGTGPSCSQDNLNQIEETHSDLIPRLSKEKTLLVRDILTKLFAIISNTDLNRNNGNKPSNNTWSRRRSSSDLSRSRPNFIRQDTWEVDPQTNSPPKLTSSPLPDRSKSVSHLLLNIDKEQMLADLLFNVKENLDKALILLPNKNDSTFIKLNEKRTPDIEIKDSSFTIQDVNKSISEILNSTPKKSQNKENVPHFVKKENKQFIVPSKFGTFTKKIDNHTPRKNAVPFVKRDTPIPLAKKLGAPLSPNIPDRRLSLGAFSKATRPNLNLSGCNSSINNSKSGMKLPTFGLKHSQASNKMGTSTPKKFK